MTISRGVLAKYLKGDCVFYETGARWGDTVIKALELGALEAHSCEIDPLQWAMACAHVTDAIPAKRGRWGIYLRDSAGWLSGCIGSEYASVVVFLDAHTATECRVLDELRVLATWKTPPSIILIDDMRCMKGWGFKREDLIDGIERIGDYAIDFDDGVEEGDILVARLQRRPVQG